jgi:predicted aspartyl protease
VASVKAEQPRKKRKVERNEATEDHMSRNSMTEKDVDRKLPKQVIVEAFINGQSVRAMMDTGSMMDFISTRLVDQLKIPKEVLVKPVPLFMTVSGSRSKVNCSVTANLQ